MVDFTTCSQDLSAEATVNDPMNNENAETDQGKALIYSNRSAASADAGRFEAARLEAVHAISLQPMWANARWNLGVALEGLGKFEAALYSYSDGLLLEPSNIACKAGVANMNNSAKRSVQSPVLTSSGNVWDFINFRTPCKECSKNPNGQQMYSFDGTMTVKHHKLQRFPGAGRQQSAVIRPRVTDRISRSLFKRLKAADTTPYTQLLKLGKQIGEAIKQCSSDEVVNGLLIEFISLFRCNDGVLPELLLNLIQFATSPQLSNVEKVMFGKFLKECCSFQCVTLWLPIVAVQSLREICTGLLCAPLQGLTAPGAAICVVRDHCRFFADLLAVLPISAIRMPTHIIIPQFLVYVCDRAEAVQAVLSGDPVPSFSLIQDSYNPVKNMEAFCFIPGQLSGCKGRETRMIPIDKKKDHFCDLCHKNYGHITGSNYTMYAFCNLVNSYPRYSNTFPGTIPITVKLLTLSQHGHCNGWRLLEGDEGCTDPYEVLFSYLPKPPKVVMYDNACNLSE